MVIPNTSKLAWEARIEAYPNTGDFFFGHRQSKGNNPNISQQTTKKTVPSGKRLHNYGKIHHFQWENPLFLWPFSIAILT